MRKRLFTAKSLIPVVFLMTLVILPAKPGDATVIVQGQDPSQTDHLLVKGEVRVKRVIVIPRPVEFIVPQPIPSSTPRRPIRFLVADLDLVASNTGREEVSPREGLSCSYSVWDKEGQVVVMNEPMALVSVGHRLELAGVTPIEERRGLLRIPIEIPVNPALPAHSERIIAKVRKLALQESGAPYVVQVVLRHGNGDIGDGIVLIEASR